MRALFIVALLASAWPEPVHAQSAATVQGADPRAQPRPPDAVPNLQLGSQPPRTRRRYGFLIAAGATATVGGAAILVAAFTGIGKGVCEGLAASMSGCDGADTTVAVLLGTGAVLLVASIPLLVIGLQKVPVEEAAPAPRAPPVATQGSLTLSASAWDATAVGLQLTAVVP